MGKETDGNAESEEERVKRLVNKQNYEKNRGYYQQYYQDNKDRIQERSRVQWNKMSSEEKRRYYQERKKRRIRQRRIINKGLEL